MPNPYDKTTHDGKTVDWITKCALLEAEIKLGYRLTVVQGSYHRGVSASAGTHDGGGCVDLAAWDHVRKVRVLRDLGFAVWYRPTLPGVWSEHIHGVLIGNEKLAPVAARQVTAFHNRRDGLAGNRIDNTYHPPAGTVYRWPGSDAALALVKKAADLLDKPKPAPKPAVTPLPIDIVDLSHHNDVTLAKLKAAVKVGVRGFYLKATEGTSFVDSKYATNRKLVAQAGSTVGAYHFARPASSDGTTQARFFLSVAKPKTGDFRIMLDLEDRGGKSQAALTKWVGEFRNEVVRQLGIQNHLIYTPFDLDDNFGWSLWVARYHPTNARPAIPKPWKEWKVRQFSDGQTGVPRTVAGLGAVDLNNVVGSVTGMKMPAPAVKPPVVTPKPTPTPTPTTPASGSFINGQFNWQHTDAANDQFGDIRLEADVWGLNEIESLWQRLRLKALAGWGMYPTLGTAAYVPILWKKSKFEKVSAETHEVHKGVKGVTPTRNINVVTLRHKATGKLVTRINTQVVAHIEVGGKARVYTGAEAVKYAGQLDRAKASFTMLRRLILTQTEPTVVGGDFNVDALAEQRLPEAQRVPWFPLTALSPVATPVIPAGGTHGSRAIDWTLLRGLKAVRQWVGKQGASDHKPVFTEIEI